MQGERARVPAKSDGDGWRRPSESPGTVSEGLSRAAGDYAVLVLLIGLIGGVAMGSVQAGRRTQSSYPAFLASTNLLQI